MKVQDECDECGKEVEAVKADKDTVPDGFKMVIDSVKCGECVDEGGENVQLSLVKDE